jgi:hypothetical protein
MRRVLLASVCGLGLIVCGTAPSQACGFLGCLFGHFGHHGCFAPCCPPPCGPAPCYRPQPCCPTACFAPQPCCPTGVGYAPILGPTCPTGTCQQTAPLAPATAVYRPAPARTVYEVAPLRFPRLVQRPFARPTFFGPFGRAGVSETVSHSEDAPQSPPTRHAVEPRPTTSSMLWDAMNVVR